MNLPGPIHINDVDISIEYPRRPTVIVEGDKAYKIVEGREVNNCVKYQRIINGSHSPHLLRSTNVYVLHDHVLLEYERLDRCVQTSDLRKEVIDQIFQCLDDLDQLNLSHGDIHLKNFMFRGDTVVAIDYTDMGTDESIRYQLLSIMEDMDESDDKEYFLSEINKRYPEVLSQYLSM